MVRDSSPWIPAAMTVASALMTTLEAVFLRMLGPDASQGQVLLFRSGMQLALVAALGPMLVGSFAKLVGTTRMRSHMLRGTLAAVSWWCYFMSFKTLPLALATTMTFSSQLFVLMLVGPILRERVTGPQLASTLVGFLGVLVAARIFTPATLDWHVLYALASAFMGAVMILITRSLSFTDRTETILFYMALVVFVSAIPQCVVDWQPLPARAVVLLLAMALTGTLGASLMVEAYRRAAPSALAPYSYVRLVFAAVLGIWLFADTILPTTLVGAVLIVASNLVMVFFSARGARSAAS